MLARKRNLRGKADERPASSVESPRDGGCLPGPSISLCLITKDEERFIENCIKSVEGLCGQVVVVDTGSSDRTVEIVESCGAEIHHFAWTDSFADARNESIKYATGKWILILDADGELVADSKEVIRRLVREHSYPTTFAGKSINYAGDGSTVSESLFTMLFANGHGIHFRGAVHERLLDANEEPLSSTLGAPIYMRHYGYLSEIKLQKDKDNRNRRLLDRELESASDDFMLRYHSAVQYGAVNDFDRAVPEFLACLKAMDEGRWNPGRTEFWRAQLNAQLASLHVAAGRRQEAEEYAREGLRTDPANVQARFRLGEALLTSGRFEEAVEVLEGMRREPNEAHDLTAPAVSRSMRTWRTSQLIAEAKLNLGQYEGAFEEARAAVEGNSRAGDAWLLGSAAAALMGDFETALGWLGVGLTLEADPEKAESAFGEVRAVATDLASFEAVLREAKRLSPDSALVAKMLLEVAETKLLVLRLQERGGGFDEQDMRDLDRAVAGWPRLLQAWTARNPSSA